MVAQWMGLYKICYIALTFDGIYPAAVVMGFQTLDRVSVSGEP